MLCIFFFFLMIRRPPRSTLDRSSAASDVYKRQQIRDIEYVDVKGEKYILFARYDDELEVYKVSN